MISRTLKNVVLALIVFIWVVPFVALITTSLRSELASKNLWFLDVLYANRIRSPFQHA